MSKEVILHYGALSDPLEQQANAQGFTLGDNAELLQELNNAVITCWIYDLCTDSQHNAIVNKLQKGVMKALKPIESED